MKASIIVISAQLEILTLFVVSPALSEWLGVPWMEVNPGFRDPEKVCLSPGVPSLERIDTKITWTFFRDQILCPLNGGDPWIEVSQRRGSTVGEIESLWSIIMSVVLNRTVGDSECMTTFVRVVVIFRAKVSRITSMVKSSGKLFVWLVK